MQDADLDGALAPALDLPADSGHEHRPGADGFAVVFRVVEAQVEGRARDAGAPVKFNFVESASFVVLARNSQRSVTLGLYPAGGDTPGPAGNVTIPPNHEVPAPGDVVEIKYLCAHRQSGAVYQPVYLGKRHDIPATECGVEQLKYKPEPAS